MKFLVLVSLIAAASAGIIKPAIVSQEVSEVQQIIAAIQSPSTDPATAAALEAMLLESLGVSPIQVGPAIVDSIPEAVQPIAVGPAVVDFPLPDGGALTEGQSPVVVAAPAVVAPVAEAAVSAPLVQIILNIRSDESESVVMGAPAAAPAVAPEVVSVAESAVDAVTVVEAAVEAVSVVEPVIQPVAVVDAVAQPVVVVDAVAQPVAVVDAVAQPVAVVDAVAQPVVSSLDFVH